MIAKAGDKVIYIGEYYNKYNILLLNGSTYTIRHITQILDHYLYELDEFNRINCFISNKFETISEYRKRKLEKINNL